MVGPTCHDLHVSSLLVEQGWAALREGDAAGARSAFGSALEEVGSGEVLEGLAQSLYFESDYTAAAIHYELAYAAYGEERDALAAGRAARTIAWITGNVWRVVGPQRCRWNLLCVLLGMRTD